MTRPLARHVGALVLGLSLFTLGVKSAEATHFLGGSLYWERDLTFVSTTHDRYTVTLEANWRWSFQWPVAYPPVGTTFDTGTYHMIVQGTGYSASVPIVQQAVAVNQADDWMVARSTMTVLVPKTSYPVTMTFNDCCRDSTLREGNNDVDWTLRAVIPNSTVTRAPRSTMLPRVYLQQAQPVSIQMPTIAYDGLTNVVGFAPASDSSLVTTRPIGQSFCTGAGCSACNTNFAGACALGMNVSPSGLIAWTPQVAGEYAVQFKITSRDAGGNPKVSTAYDMVFEVKAACVGCNPPYFDPAPAVSSNVTAGFTHTLPMTVRDPDAGQSVTIATTPLPAGALLQLLGNPAAVPLQAQVKWTPTGAQVGPHNICFQATDSTGRTSLGQPCSTITVLPNQPPVLECPVDPIVVNATNPMGELVSLFASTADPEGVPYTVRWKVGPVIFDLSPIAAGASLTPIDASFQFPIGTHNVVLEAFDGVSTGTCSISVTVNRIAQSISFAPPLEVNLGSGPLALDATATSGLPVFYELVEGPATLSGNVLSFTSVGFVRVLAKQAGDATYAPANDVEALIEVKDATAPAIDPHGPESAEATSASGAVVVYTSPGWTDNVDSPGTASCAPASGSTFALGTTTVTCTASDAAGNSSTSSFVVTVADTTAPTIDPHADVPGTATGPAGGVVNYDAPATHDLVDGDGTATCAPASGSTFQLGTTTVTCTATDAAGNPAASTSFSVIITNTAPTISVPADITAEATSAAGAAVIFAASGNDAEDGVLAASCSTASGATFSFGTTPVTCTVTDAVGVSASASFNVTVSDTTAPQVAYTGNAGSYGIGQTVNITCSATDAVGVVSSTCANISGPAYTFALGTNTFSATATDAAGNTGSGSASFTVTASLTDLQGLVTAFCASPAAGGMNAKLAAAAGAPNANARQGQLGAFTNQVAAQTGKCLTPAQAALLVQLVQAFY